MVHENLNPPQGDLGRWIASLRDDDRTESTLEEYSRDLREFLAWAKLEAGEIRVSELLFSMTTAREYRQHLMDKRLSPFTVNRRLGTVAQFLSWLEVPESQNPSRRLKRVEIERVAPKALTRNEWNALRRAAESQIAKDSGLALAVISLCRHAGLRAGEVAALSVADVELAERSGRATIRQGKGMKHRVVPLVLEAREGLEPWVLSREKWCERFMQRNTGAEVPSWMDAIDGAFVFGQRGVLTPRGINHITQRIWTAAGFQGSLGPHALRHTFAKSALDPKAYGLARDSLPLPALQQAMGHSRIDTTSVYTKFSESEIGQFLEEK
jgi:site-specific recombinase XerD